MTSAKPRLLRPEAGRCSWLLSDFQRDQSVHERRQGGSAPTRPTSSGVAQRAHELRHGRGPPILRDEHADLVTARAAAAKDTATLARLHAQLVELEARIASAIVVTPAHASEVRFGVLDPELQQLVDEPMHLPRCKTTLTDGRIKDRTSLHL